MRSTLGVWVSTQPTVHGRGLRGRRQRTYAQLHIHSRRNRSPNADLDVAERVTAAVPRTRVELPGQILGPQSQAPESGRARLHDSRCPTPGSHVTSQRGASDGFAGSHGKHEDRTQTRGKRRRRGPARHVADRDGDGTAASDENPHSLMES